MIYIYVKNRRVPSLFKKLQLLSLWNEHACTYFQWHIGKMCYFQLHIQCTYNNIAPEESPQAWVQWTHIHVIWKNTLHSLGLETRKCYMWMGERTRNTARGCLYTEPDTILRPQLVMTKELHNYSLLTAIYIMYIRCFRIKKMAKGKSVGEFFSL